MAPEDRSSAEDGRETYYTLLGLSEECTAEDLKNAFRQRVLVEHPDKGGDADRFAELNRIYRTLEDPQRREEYDLLLERARERRKLVQGLHEGDHEDEYDGALTRPANQPDGPLKPRPGYVFTRAGWAPDRKPQACSHEWKGKGSAMTVLKAIADDATPEMKTERLFNVFATLPRGKEKKREWIKGVLGQDRTDLKQYAKKVEQAEMKKAMQWLAGPKPKAERKYACANHNKCDSSKMASGRTPTSAAAKPAPAAEPPKGGLTVKELHLKT
mmetsp:Transcript_5806/g.15666  ORF Transcript_5806/g.15666 Transcript_5806/m.15666 type:complete len:271 (-) Transcript_5806:104-916(-)